MSTLVDAATIIGIIIVFCFLIAINVMIAKYISHHLNISALVAFIILWIFPPAGFILLLVAFFKPAHVHPVTYPH